MTQVNLANLPNSNLVSELLSEAWCDNPEASEIEDNARWQRCMRLYQEITKRMEKE